MKKSKKVFLFLAAIFFLIMLLIGYDISRRTTWPGAKKSMEERMIDNSNER